MIVTRFAPSPTGLLHRGHAFAALFAYRLARESHGQFLLRIEDIDTGRCQDRYREAILEDLHWLGIRWQEPIRVQSQNFEDYEAALASLDELGLLYPCFCTRKEINAEILRLHGAPHGPPNRIYPGTCKNLSKAQQQDRIFAGENYALRLDVSRAMSMVDQPLRWHDRHQGWQQARPEILGDIVLARKDTPASYHLCCTLDDHIQGVNLITRGKDLFVSTHVHRLLQALLDLDTPEWLHHELLMDEYGRRLAKRDHSQTLASYRARGLTPADLELDSPGTSRSVSL